MFVRYITVGNQTIYNLKDFCLVCKLPFNKIKQFLNKKYWWIKLDSANVPSLFIDCETMYKIILKYNIKDTNVGYHFTQLARRNAFSEQNIDNKNKRIYIS